MQVAMLVIQSFILLFMVNVAGHLDRIQKTSVLMLQAKVEELKMWNGVSGGK